MSIRDLTLKIWLRLWIWRTNYLMILELISLEFIMVSRRSIKVLNWILIMKVLFDISRQRIMGRDSLLLILAISLRLPASLIKLIFFYFRYSRLVILILLELEPLQINNKYHIRIITSLFLSLVKDEVLAIINKF